MRKSASLATVAVLAALAATSSAAQGTPIDRAGLYVDAGASFAQMNNAYQLIETNGAVNAKSEVAYAVGVGWGLKGSAWRLGLQGDYVTQDDIQPSSTFTLITAAGTYYPVATNGLWLRLNLGWGQNRLSTGILNGSGGGLAAGIGIGYDFLLADRKLSLTPYMQYMGMKTNAYSGDWTGFGIHGQLMMFEIGLTVGYRH